MPSQSQMRSLFGLPLELREQIYESVLLTSKDDFQLLQTCRAIHDEAYQFLFKRPLTFKSQGALLRWAKSVGTEHLHYVTTMTLCLVDVDQSAPASQQEIDHSSTDIEWGAYERELQAISTIMTRLPNIKALSLTSPRIIRPSKLFLEFENHVLNTLGQHFANLMSLAWYGDHQSMQFVASLHNLRSLRFTGFAQSSPHELAKILSGLHHLHDIQIGPCSFETTHGSRIPPTGSCHIGRSFTSNLLEHINNLRSISFHECALWSDAPYTFFTKDYIDAVKHHHNHSIQSVKINLDFPPTADSLAALQDLLFRSSVTHFGIGWPGMDPELLSVLMFPALELLEVYTDSPRSTVRIMQLISRQRTRAPNLKRLMLIIRPPVLSVRESEQVPIASTTNTKDGHRRDSHSETQRDTVCPNLEEMREELSLLGIQAFHVQSV
ncbi:hypothetical protein EJ05DRAFT_497797 [Pseudovirgaria hyperparasitica]|uniref:Uncharacterized protein n=1 Tax=Pseudovirgaria hyperparasitica TaxID=470096 RepID=A0A6A6WGY9_9PEZI|nr:uncharacterized protein EJ05DRAFT_497797 [Pseudovirgaria hyperparasitica]KAF2761246.1 hypothetical protein EJ05DRAFT_497797 [Pseudovirgaria hyperparasitica]